MAHNKDFLKSIEKAPMYVRNALSVAFQKESLGSINNDETLKYLINCVYGYIGNGPPMIRFYDSPLGVAEAVKVDGIGKEKVQKQILDIRERAIKECYSYVSPGQKAAIHEKIENDITGKVAQIRYALNRELKNRSIPPHIIDGFLHGQHDIDLMANLTFYRNELQVLLHDGLKSLIKISHVAGWIFPTSTVCYISRRPIEIHLDKEKRLHHATKMAIRYQDGFGLYRDHGEPFAPQAQVARNKSIFVECPVCGVQRRIKDSVCIVDCGCGVTFTR